MRTKMLGSTVVELPEERDPAGRASHGRVDFERLPNTRDLGGMVGAEGCRIKPGMLLRSGMLAVASDADLARLRDEYRLRLVVDLRNNDELAEQPDPMERFDGARFVHADILRDGVAGITQEEGARLRAAELRAAESGDRVLIMEQVYPRLLLGAAGVEGYRKLFEALLACDDGAALWHCFVGRDRCGMASVLVETALGVSDADIEQDYLATNLYAPEDLTQDCPASLRSLAAVRAAVERAYGGFMGYLTDALGVTPEQVEALRERYLA